MRLRRALWILGGALSLLLGVIGIVVPLLPTTPFVLLAAACFSRGSERWERWLLAHRTFGPLVRDWRQNRAMPLRAKQLAIAMMALGSVWAATRLPVLPWLPAACCSAVAFWMWRLPTRVSAGIESVPPATAVAMPPSASMGDSLAPVSVDAQSGNKGSD